MDTQDTWNLSLLLPDASELAITSDLEAVGREIVRFADTWKHRSDYMENPSILKTALDGYERLMRMYGTGGAVQFYFWLRHMQDQNDPVVKAGMTRATDVSTANLNAIQFFELNLAKIPAGRQREFLDSPDLSPYRHFLEKLFLQAEHLLPDAEERIMNFKEPVSYEKWVGMLEGFLSREERTVRGDDGTEKPYTLDGLLTLISSPVKPVRDTAARAINDILEKHSDLAEAELNAVLENKKVNDLIRGYTRPDASRHTSDDIDSASVDTLLDSVSRRNDIPTRFYKLKAALMGVQTLAYHERNVEYGAVSATYPYAEGIGLVDRVFARLDPEFSSIFRRFAANGQIDVYPRSGKHGGAFCSHWLVSQPTYVLLNYSDKLRDVTTIAHEFGHAINYELMKTRQNALNFGTSLATAEVASTFFEDFVFGDVLGTADAETRFALMISKLNADISTVFRQVACYRFEADLHREYRKRGYLSKTDIGNLFTGNMAAYMGSSVEQSPGSENWWIYWSHIRRYFYVYSYASGLLISKSMQHMVREDPRSIASVRTFLEAGLSMSPREIFSGMGIDITDAGFWNRGLDEIETLLTETERLAGKLGKIQ